MAANSTSTIFGAMGQVAPRQTNRAFGVLRSSIRSLAFVIVLAFAAADFLRIFFFCFHLDTLRRRALWLQRWSRVLGQIVGLELHHRGAPPRSGMIVSNHLSYLDIIAYGALMPCVFVAKKDVASWPLLGYFARMAGTIFVDRTRRTKVAEANMRITEVLRAGMVVVLFAEGTSSDGRRVLPFHSSLLEPATISHSPISPSAIGYRLDDGSVADEVCYWGDMTLLPHLLNLLTKRTVRAQIEIRTADGADPALARKDAARQTQRHVTSMHADLARWSR